MSSVFTMTRDDARYTAITNRDAQAHFLYGVVTTGVYCKPTCASRLPRRENVRFFETAMAAEDAGFRACKRCRPTSEVTSTSAELVARVCAMIDASETVPTLDEVAAAVDMSPYHLHRVFKATTGVTPRDYAIARRRERTQAALREDGSVTRAMYDAGFESSSRFYTASNQSLGMTPSAFKDAGRGITVRYAVAPCRLGHVLVAGTARGVCAVDIGDDPRALEKALGDRFANAVSVEADTDLAEWLAMVVRHIDSGAPIALPLDVRGTVFQQRVWQALQAIPRGETRTYSELAASLGKPNGARAVAAACAKNPIAVVVPCHRVIGKDGELRGYRWGLATKKQLLAAECEPRAPSRRRDR